MLDPETTLNTSVSLEAARQIDAACDRFESAWRRGERPRLEDYLRDLPPQTQTALLAELLALDLFYRNESGERPTEAEYRQRFPAQPRGIDAAFGRRATDPLPQIAGYECLERLGQGGMGVVYKARQISLNRLVALKVLPPAASVGAEPEARFRIEAEAAARLQHPNIVQVYEAGECRGVPFYAMEYVAGPTLARVLHDAPLPPRTAAEYVEQLARAVHYAHEHGVVHRDLKPANVLLDLGRTPKIADFGLAKSLYAGSELTATGQVLGTPAYMAPEQVDGAARVGWASDVYSLGAVLYATLTGRPPFRGPTVFATLAQISETEPVPPGRLKPGVPRDLETICLKCLQKEPDRRYATAQNLADDLRRWLKGEPPLARPTGPIERAGRWARRNRLSAALLVAVIVLFLIWLATLGLLLSTRTRSLWSEPRTQLWSEPRTQLRSEPRTQLRSEPRTQRSGVSGVASGRLLRSAACAARIDQAGQHRACSLRPP